jgi:ribose 5-phosphate isomerase B
VELKDRIALALSGEGVSVADFGAKRVDPSDDYPDFVLPLACAVALGEVAAGIAVCGSGIGAAIAANKVDGVRAACLHHAGSIREGVQRCGLNVLCLGARSLSDDRAMQLVAAFRESLAAGPSPATRAAQGD